MISSIVKDVEFINRENEMKSLSGAFTTDDFELFIVYGRRRVGKSRLILESIQNYNSIYFLATERDVKMNLQKFKQDAAEQLQDDHILALKDDWEIVLKYLSSQSLVIVIDEFPYLLSYDKSLKSQFQRIIDKHLISSDIKLVLAGSSLTMMKSDVLGYKSPLYGRRTGQIKVHPLAFEYLQQFFPEYDFDDLVHVYGALGGVPYYLHQFERDKPFWQNIDDHLISEFEVLFEEAEFLLREEFSSPATYMAILEQIAAGRTEVNEIKQQLSRSGDISSYLKNLREVELITRRVPLGENKNKSRHGKYYLKDNYLKFWFKFILPVKSDIQQGHSAKVLDTIKRKYNSYLGHIFEEIIYQWLVRITSEDNDIFPFLPEQIGRWWYKDTEIDLVMYTPDNQIFVEIKWSEVSSDDVGYLLPRLKQKSKVTPFNGEYYYALICKKYTDNKNTMDDLIICDKNDILDQRS